MNKIEDYLQSENYEEAFLTAKDAWLSDTNNTELLSLIIKSLHGLKENELAEQLDKYTQLSSGGEPDPQTIFMAGYKLLDKRLPEMAIFFFERCLELSPHDPTANYELGFAHMLKRDFGRAIPYLQEAARFLNDFDTFHNLNVCNIITRNFSEAENSLRVMEKLAENDEEKKELTKQQQIMKRLKPYQNKSKLSARDWLYVLYGAMILFKDVPTLALNSANKEPSYSEIAMTLLLLRDSLSELGIDVDVIEYYNVAARPLAESLGRLMDLPVHIYRGPDIADRSLLVIAWAADIIGPHRTFVKNDPLRTIFTYGLPAAEPLPITPEIIGHICPELHLPWSENTNVNLAGAEDSQPLADAARLAAVDKIIEKASQLESQVDLINTIREIFAYYDNKKDALVVNNSYVYAERPEYTAEVPLHEITA